MSPVAKPLLETVRGNVDWMNALVSDLSDIAKVRRDEHRIGVIANRVRRNTIIYQSLLRFLETLRIPVITSIRDSQNYVRAAEAGVGIHEMKRYLVEADLQEWAPLLAWLKAKEALIRNSPQDAADVLPIPAALPESA